MIDLGAHLVTLHAHDIDSSLPRARLVLRGDRVEEQNVGMADATPTLTSRPMRSLLARESRAQ